MLLLHLVIHIISSVTERQKTEEMTVMKWEMHSLLSISVLHFSPLTLRREGGMFAPYQMWRRWSVGVSYYTLFWAIYSAVSLQCIMLLQEGMIMDSSDIVDGQTNLEMLFPLWNLGTDLFLNIWEWVVIILVLCRLNGRWSVLDGITMDRYKLSISLSLSSCLESRVLCAASARIRRYAE